MDLPELDEESLKEAISSQLLPSGKRPIIGKIRNK